MPSSFPLMVVRDLLWLVLTGGSPDYLAPIQTEVHLIKQLSGSLSPKSERLGWQLKGRGALLAVLPARLSREELRRVLPTLAHDHFAWDCLGQGGIDGAAEHASPIEGWDDDADSAIFSDRHVD